MQDNTTNTANPKGIRHIHYGDNHQYRKITQNELICINRFQIWSRVLINTASYEDIILLVLGTYTRYPF